MVNASTMVLISSPSWAREQDSLAECEATSTWTKHRCEVAGLVQLVSLACLHRNMLRSQRRDLEESFLTSDAHPVLTVP